VEAVNVFRGFDRLDDPRCVDLRRLVKAITVVSSPFIPQTAQQLYQTLNLPGTVQQCRWIDATVPVEAGTKINKPQPLFHKIDTNEDVLDEQLAQVRAKNGGK
jgi:methionyl-tRNA synthetase